MSTSTERQKNNNNYISADIFTGTVVSCNPGTMVVEVAPDGNQSLKIVQGIPLSHVFASAIGFKETLLYPVGSRVVCQGLGGHQAIIFGAAPPTEKQGDTIANMPSKIALDADEPLGQSVHKNGYLGDSTKLNVMNNGLPTDVVQGEKVIANEFGVLLGLFQLVAMLRASDLSQIQCHFLDDLVRIVSHNFQHYTSLGELSVSHDGQAINLEVGATHDPNESLGIPTTSTEATITAVNAQAPDTTGTKNANDFYQLTKNARALERLKVFVGKLGGFINLLLCLPSGETPGEKSIPDAGLLQVKANLDGSLIIRSANGIYLEKTDWIRVPQRLLTPDDPSGDDGKTVTYPPHMPYEFDDQYKYREVAFLYYLQLRDYLAYTNEELGYSDFKTLSKDFYVNGDYTKNDVEGRVYIDPKTGASFKRTRAVIALMPNGGIAMADNWGSCIAMEGGNIYIQPAKDLVMQPGRNMIAKVGANISLAAQLEVDVSSTKGGFRLKTDKAQHLYSDNSGILLHANGTLSEPGVVPYTPDYRTVSHVSGVVLHAPNSGVTGNAEQVYFNAKDKMILSSKNNTTIYSDDWLRLYSKNLISTNSNNLQSLTNDSTIIYSGSQVLMTGLISTAVGTTAQTYGIAEAGDIKAPVKGFLDPDKGQKKFFDAMAKVNSTANTFKVGDMLASFKSETAFDDIEFQFLPSLVYQLTKDDVIPQTYSQQQNILAGIAQTAWEETEVNSSYPYPGADFQDQSYATKAASNLENLNNQLANKTVELLNKTDDIQTSNVFTDYKL